MKIFLFILIIFVSCAKEAEQKVQTSNTKFQVEKLFTNDGCVVYRFEDVGRYVYYLNCPGTTSSSYSCGKNCHKHDEVKTN